MEMDAGGDPLGSDFVLRQELMRRDCLELCCGCECGNRFLLLPRTKTGKKPLRKIYLTEESTCCQKVFCGPCRALTMHGYFFGSDQNEAVNRREPATDVRVMEMSKDCACVCCCCCCGEECTKCGQPKLFVKLSEDINTNFAEKDKGFAPIGHIQNHAACCKVRQTISRKKSV